MQTQDKKLKLYDEGAGRQICGSITITFKFEKDLELPYDQKSCIINDHILKWEENECFIRPLDLNIEYCYILDEKEEIRLNVGDYELDDISDFEDWQKWDEQQFSRFYFDDFTNSPDNRYIFLWVGVDIIKKYETYRLIIIDTFTQNIKKMFFRTHFIEQKSPLFSKDGNLAFINITKNEEQSRFLILNLKNGIQEEKIIKLPHSIRKIDYDVKSGCLFYITHNCEIHQQPLNQDGTIDISMEKIYKINWKSIDLFGSFITLTLLSDSIVLLADDSGQLFVFRIRNNCKTVKYYWLKQYLPPQYICKNQFVVMADTYSKYHVLFDISRCKLIRQNMGIHYSKVDGYHERDSYYLSIVSFSICKKPNDNQFSVGSHSEGESEMRKKQSIFDLIRGTEIEIKEEGSSDSTCEIFKRNIIMRNYQNKLSYKLKL